MGQKHYLHLQSCPDRNVEVFVYYIVCVCVCVCNCFYTCLREGVMEFLLANHPLDCPICDQGGECDLQVTNKGSLGHLTLG